jgi:RND family efflux transporter MFP subunit
VSESQARIVSAQAARTLAQATLDKTEVRAPFDGIVVLKDAEVGEVVSPNSQGGSNARGSIVTMVDWATLEVQVDLQETSLGSAHEGAAVSIYLDAWPDKRYAGHVRRVWPTANRQKATVEVRVAIDDPDDKLRPEMGARVVFGSPSASDTVKTAPEEPALLVQRSAIVRIDGKDGVFVLERDVARFRPVTLGGERSGRVIVKSGVADGETVVDDPPTKLADGDRVRIQE